MKFTWQPSFKKDVPLVVLVFQKEDTVRWSAPAQAFPETLLKMAREDGFQAKPEETIFLRPPQGKPVERMLLVSVGKTLEANLHSLRKAAAAAAKRASEARLKTFAFLVPEQFETLQAEAQTIVEGILLGLYRFDRHKSQPSAAFEPLEIVLVTARSSGAVLRQAMEQGEAFARAVNFARDLINEPPSLKTPEILGKTARALTGRGVQARVYNKAQLKTMKMNALLGVNRGSAHPPVLVHLHYKPAGKPQKRLAFVGKGITFDSGGLSLKPADGMMTMKYDMSGAATVFALFHALRVLRPPVEVHGVAPITENMPGHDAYKPGDVVRAANGKTIEVLNTDAEGRVVLADALSYTSQLPVDEIIDIATLTGAVAIALGKAYAGVMSNNNSLQERLKTAAEKTGEKIWPLPLETSYKEHIKSKVADLKNIGNPGEAGTIIGGLFLQEFVGDKPWAHLDIAGVGWNSNGTVLSAPGATGVMIRTLLHYILNGGKP